VKSRRSSGVASGVPPMALILKWNGCGIPQSIGGTPMLQFGCFKRLPPLAFYHRRRHVRFRKVIACIIASALSGPVGCNITSDVTHQPRYQVGWEPDHVYCLITAKDLLHVDGTNEYHFEDHGFYPRDPATLPVGTKEGSTSEWEGFAETELRSHDEICIWNAPIGTRVKVDRLIRKQGLLIKTYTTAIGHLLDGPYAGTTISLFECSRRIDMDGGEGIDVPWIFTEHLSR
jgi:hypothetical protein